MSYPKVRCRVCGAPEVYRDIAVSQGLCTPHLRLLTLYRKVLPSAQLRVSFNAFVEEYPEADTESVTKRCSNCQEEKPATEFGFDKGRLKSYCRKCDAKYHSDYQLTRSGRLGQVKGKKAVRQIRASILQQEPQQVQNVCNECGESKASWEFYRNGRTPHNRCRSCRSLTAPKK